MKAFVIAIEDHEYSEAKAARCIETGQRIGGIHVERFKAIDAYHSASIMQHYGLKWTWASNNTSESVCPISGLKQRPYGNLAAKIGCSMSHYLLWKKCVEIGEPILILEHDSVFVSLFEDFCFRSVCMVNDPAGATPKGLWWQEQMVMRGPGLYPKTRIFPDDIPDGLAGNSAYVIRPSAAAIMINHCKHFGLWPNDAIMCRQFMDLEERYPFITKVEQTISTTS